MRKTIVSIILSVIFTMSMSLFAFADTDITLIVDGKKLNMDQRPIIANGKTLVPIRTIAEAFNLRVSWTAEVNCAFIFKNDGNQIVIEVDSNTAAVDGKIVNLDAPAQLINGRVMVPLRFISEALGAKVGWDGTTRTVTIISNEQNNAVQMAINPSTDQNTSEIKIFVNNTQVEFDQVPVLTNGVVLAQADAFLRAIHVYNFDYNNVARILTAFDGLKSLEYQIGSARARVNFDYYDLGSAPTIENSYVMIPVEFTAKAYGAAVRWVTETNSMYITLDAGESVEPKKEEIVNLDNKPLDENGKEIHIGDVVGKGGFYGSVLDINGTKILVYWDSKTAIIPDQDIDYWTIVMGVKWKSSQWVESKDVEIESSGY
ncbi:MAG: copper amine oxidase N-terminal domain-containing protein [Bacillota bacterium]